MSELISGKEAKLAWANNKEVEYMPLNKWNLLGGSTPLSIFDRDDVKFRLKPRGGLISIAVLRDQLAKREPMELRAVDIPHGTIVLEK